MDASPSNILATEDDVSVSLFQKTHSCDLRIPLSLRKSDDVSSSRVFLGGSLFHILDASLLPKTLPVPPFFSWMLPFFYFGHAPTTKSPYSLLEVFHEATSLGHLFLSTSHWILTGWFIQIFLSTIH